jgi:hypothetical protein
MASITLAVDDTLKADMEHFSWVNWSEVAREEVTKRLEHSESLEKFLKIISKSKLTDKDAELLSAKVKESMHRRLKEEGLI